MRLLIVLLCAGMLVACGGTTVSAPQQLTDPTAMSVATMPPGGANLSRTPVASSGATASPRGSAAPVTNGATIGSRITIGEVAVTLHGVQDNAPAGVLAPKADTRRYAVEITIENTSREPAPYSALFGKLGDTANAEYLPVISDQPAPSLSGGLLDPGASIRGWLAFDLPTGSGAARFTYDQLLSSGTFALP